ncbi:efflux RND transporter permease subunit [Sphingomonadaceae bacterium jetA1]|uniref:efflux RND transporter permease subunit n=1 Tax=Facivitalis istanbulensis TaxID=3075838 RepID=UPI00346B4D03
MDRFNLSRWAVRHPALVGFLIALLFAAGAVQFLWLGRDEDPGFTLKEMIVSARWDGASPAQMQAQVADPVERTLHGIDYLDYLQTYCLEGACVITVELKDAAPAARVQEVWTQVRRKLKDLEPALPPGAVLAASEDNADVYGYVFAFTGADNARLVRMAEQARDAMLRVPGAGKAEIIGEQPRRLFVEVDPRRLATMGLSPARLAQALAQRQAIGPAASVSGAMQTPVRLGGRIDSATDLEGASIATPAGAVRLRDIARVTRGYADPPEALVRHAGRQAVVLAVSMAPGADGLGFGKAIRAAAEQVRRTLPAGAAMTQIEDQSANIREAVDTFLIKFFCALTVVLVVAFVTLGWRTGIVVALSVPLTLAIVALMMGASGIGLERISLGALILSLGLLVDDAIISVEAMVVQMEQGVDRREAAAYAWTHTAFPMLTGTLITVVGFLPVGLARSTTSEYAGGIFWVTGSALLVSWIVAVVFTPFLGIRLLPDMASAPGHSAAQSALSGHLRRAIEAALARRWLVVGVTTALLAVSLWGASFVRQQFFPYSDRAEVMIDLAMRPGSAVEATARAVARLEDRLRGDPRIRSVDSYIGRGAPRFYLPYGPALPDPARATVMVVATDLKARDALIATLERMPGIAGADLHVRRLSLGPTLGAPVQYRVIGRDPARLRAIAERIAATLRALPTTTAVQINWGIAMPVARYLVDPARAARLGVDRTQLADDLAATLSGAPAGEVLQGTRRIGVMVRGRAEDRHDLGALRDMPVATPQGMVPLGEVATLAPDTEQPIVWKRDAALAMTVQADMIGDVQASEVVNAARARIAAIRATLPPGYRIEEGGDGELSADANRAIFKLLPVTLGLMLLLLMIQLQSVGRTMLVLATAPLGIIGAVAALLLTGAPFGFVALLGLIALAGMIMRNTIILVDQVQRHLAEGLALRTAIVEATVGRARPVVLTALAAVLAFIPLCFNIFWGPMAIVMIGGLIGATILTLIALPALYLLLFGGRDNAGETAHD